MVKTTDHQSLKLPNLDFLQNNAQVVARELIGWRLFTRQPNGNLIGGTITETEAYDQTDAASHSFNGKTNRNKVMFGPAGYIYVYFTYGMHYCVNIVTGAEGSGEAVLIRSIAPEQGLDVIKQNRNSQPDHLLTNGPAKLCQALSINKKDNGKLINAEDIILLPPKIKYKISATKRIGIKKDTDRLWRFVALES